MSGDELLHKITTPFSRTAISHSIAGEFLFPSVTTLITAVGTKLRFYNYASTVSTPQASTTTSIRHEFPQSHLEYLFEIDFHANILGLFSITPKLKLYAEYYSISDPSRFKLENATRVASKSQPTSTSTRSQHETSTMNIPLDLSNVHQSAFSPLDIYHLTNQYHEFDSAVRASINRNASPSSTPTHHHHLRHVLSNLTYQQYFQLCALCLDHFGVVLASNASIHWSMYKYLPTLQWYESITQSSQQPPVSSLDRRIQPVSSTNSGESSPITSHLSDFNLIHLEPFNIQQIAINTLGHAQLPQNELLQYEVATTQHPIRAFLDKTSSLLAVYTGRGVISFIPLNIFGIPSISTNTVLINPNQPTSALSAFSHHHAMTKFTATQQSTQIIETNVIDICFHTIPSNPFHPHVNLSSNADTYASDDFTAPTSTTTQLSEHFIMLMVLHTSPSGQRILKSYTIIGDVFSCSDLLALAHRPHTQPRQSNLQPQSQLTNSSFTLVSGPWPDIQLDPTMSTILSLNTAHKSLQHDVNPHLFNLDTFSVLIAGVHSILVVTPSQHKLEQIYPTSPQSPTAFTNFQHILPSPNQINQNIASLAQLPMISQLSNISSLKHPFFNLSFSQSDFTLSTFSRAITASSTEHSTILSTTSAEYQSTMTDQSLLPLSQITSLALLPSEFVYSPQHLATTATITTVILVGCKDGRIDCFTLSFQLNQNNHQITPPTTPLPQSTEPKIKKASRGKRLLQRQTALPAPLPTPQHSSSNWTIRGSIQYLTHTSPVSAITPLLQHPTRSDSQPSRVTNSIFCSSLINDAVLFDVSIDQTRVLSYIAPSTYSPLALTSTTNVFSEKDLASWTIAYKLKPSLKFPIFSSFSDLVTIPLSPIPTTSSQAVHVWRPILQQRLSEKKMQSSHLVTHLRASSSNSPLPPLYPSHLSDHSSEPAVFSIACSSYKEVTTQLIPPSASNIPSNQLLTIASFPGHAKIITFQQGYRLIPDVHIGSQSPLFSLQSAVPVTLHHAEIQAETDTSAAAAVAARSDSLIIKQRLHNFDHLEFFVTSTPTLPIQFYSTQDTFIADKITHIAHLGKVSRNNHLALISTRQSLHFLPLSPLPPQFPPKSQQINTQKQQQQQAINHQNHFNIPRILSLCRSYSALSQPISTTTLNDTSLHQFGPDLHAIATNCSINHLTTRRLSSTSCQFSIALTLPTAINSLHSVHTQSPQSLSANNPPSTSMLIDAELSPNSSQTSTTIDIFSIGILSQHHRQLLKQTSNYLPFMYLVLTFNADVSSADSTDMAINDEQDQGKNDGFEIKLCSLSVFTNPISSIEFSTHNNLLIAFEHEQRIHSIDVSKPITQFEVEQTTSSRIPSISLSQSSSVLSLNKFSDQFVIAALNNGHCYLYDAATNFTHFITSFHNPFQFSSSPFSTYTPHSTPKIHPHYAVLSSSRCVLYISTPSPTFYLITLFTSPTSLAITPLSFPTTTLFPPDFTLIPISHSHILLSSPTCSQLFTIPATLSLTYQANSFSSQSPTQSPFRTLDNVQRVCFNPTASILCCLATSTPTLSPNSFFSSHISTAHTVFSQIPAPTATVSIPAHSPHTSTDRRIEPLSNHNQELIFELPTPLFDPSLNLIKPDFYTHTSFTTQHTIPTTKAIQLYKQSAPLHSAPALNSIKFFYHNTQFRLVFQQSVSSANIEPHRSIKPSKHIASLLLLPFEKPTAICALVINNGTSRYPQGHQPFIPNHRDKLGPTQQLGHICLPHNQHLCYYCNHGRSNYLLAADILNEIYEENSDKIVNSSPMQTVFAIATSFITSSPSKPSENRNTPQSTPQWPAFSRLLLVSVRANPSHSSSNSTSPRVQSLDTTSEAEFIVEILAERLVGGVIMAVQPYLNGLAVAIGNMVQVYNIVDLSNNHKQSIDYERGFQQNQEDDWYKYRYGLIPDPFANIAAQSMVHNLSVDHCQISISTVQHGSLQVILFPHLLTHIEFQDVHKQLTANSHPQAKYLSSKPFSTLDNTNDVFGNQSQLGHILYRFAVVGYSAEAKYILHSTQLPDSDAMHMMNVNQPGIHQTHLTPHYNSSCHLQSLNNGRVEIITTSSHLKSLAHRKMTTQLNSTHQSSQLQSTSTSSLFSQDPQLFLNQYTIGKISLYDTINKFTSPQPTVFDCHTPPTIVNSSHLTPLQAMLAQQQPFIEQVETQRKSMQYFMLQPCHSLLTLLSPPPIPAAQTIGCSRGGALYTVTLHPSSNLLPSIILQLSILVVSYQSSVTASSARARHQLYPTASSSVHLTTLFPSSPINLTTSQSNPPLSAGYLKFCHILPIMEVVLTISQLNYQDMMLSNDGTQRSIFTVFSSSFSPSQRYQVALLFFQWYIHYTLRMYQAYGLLDELKVDFGTMASNVQPTSLPQLVEVVSQFQQHSMQKLSKLIPLPIQEEAHPAEMGSNSSDFVSTILNLIETFINNKLTE